MNRVTAILSVSNIFGLLPFKVKITNNIVKFEKKTYTKLEITKISVYIVLIILGIVNFFVQLQEKLVRQIEGESTTSDNIANTILLNLLDLSYYQSVLLTFFTQFLYRNKIADAMNLLVNAHKKISDAQIVIDHSNFMPIYLFAFSFITYVNILRLYLFNDLLTLEGICEIILGNFFDTARDIILFQWYFYLKIMNRYYSALNRMFYKLKYDQYWLVKDFKLPKTNTEITKYFLDIAQVYDQLCGCVKIVNKAFAPTIISLVLVSFGVMVSDLFMICKRAKTGQIIYIFFPCTLATCIVRMFVCIVPCIEVKQCADLFTKKMNGFCIKWDQDSEINEMINTLNLQIYHQKVVFHTYNLYEINGSLLTSIFSALITYIIILVQFDVTN